MTKEGRAPGAEAGFTLVEVMISLALFGLIAVAGVALVDGILNVQGRTDVRLERLAQLQRAMFVVTADLDQASAGTIKGGGEGIEFTRAAPGVGGAAVPMHYGVVNNGLIRFYGPRPQLLLPGVSGVRWRFWDGEWLESWPRDEEHAADWPQAVELTLTAAPQSGPAGTLRRVIALPKNGGKR